MSLRRGWQAVKSKWEGPMERQTGRSSTVCELFRTLTARTDGHLKIRWFFPSQYFIQRAREHLLSQLFLLFQCQITSLAQDHGHVSGLRATDLPTFYPIRQLHRFSGSWFPYHIQLDETLNDRHEESHNRLAGHRHETVRRIQH